MFIVRNDGTTGVITDFSNQDMILVSADNFRYFDRVAGKFTNSRFDKQNFLVSGTDPKSTTALAQFLYDTDDGKLYYDADGVGLDYDTILVATLSNKAALNASHFLFDF
jgi:hypothetical protein